MKRDEVSEAEVSEAEVEASFGSSVLLSSL